MSKTVCSLVALTALAGTACVALAQAGPDVIVGDLYDPQNYTSSGPVNGMRAYAIGTISCNLGNDPLTWESGTNQHPVISQNMYRMLNGRFEQVGQAWLKHGFCALQGTICSTCTPGGSCPALFPGCSDPYSGGLNGSQGGLGPKSEVNAANGFFPYPWVNQGSGNATLRKRLLVADADMGNAGALYFVSSMYVQPEDAAHGNKHNNESYRRVNVAANKDISLAGNTMRTRPAIFAWRDNGLGAGSPDPDVQLTAVDVPNDGRFWVGSKATDNGNGTWTYEYAIQNLNSDRSGQSFSVPVPAGASVTNIGFHDIDYHSGEPYTNTDWTNAVSGGAVTWSTQTHAANVNANALRWDTIYNFRFTCNVPPAGGQSTLTLFKPGTPTSVSALAVAPSADGQAHPLNDSCATAADIGDGAMPFSNVGATTDGPAEPNACVIEGDRQVGSDIWYRYTAQCSGELTISTCGSAYDTKMAVYGANCPTGSDQLLACSDDDGGCNLGSQLTVTVTEGASYLIRVGGYAGAQGTGTLTLTGPSCGPQPPANDACASASWIAAGTPVNGSTALATNDGTATCGASESSPDVWFKYRPTTSGQVTATTCGGTSNYDTVLSAYSGACGALSQLTCNDDTCNLQSQVSFNGVAGQTYYIRVSGYQGDTGNYTLTVTGGGGAIPPINDDCSGRSGISLGTVAFDTTAASTDSPALTWNGGSVQVSNDIWFNYPSQCDGTLTISTCGSGFDTRVAVFSGSGCTGLQGRLLSYNDNEASCGTGSRISIPVTSGNNYTILVGGAGAAIRGAGSLTLTCTPPCSVDFNGDGFLDFFDYDDYVTCYTGGGCPDGRTADFNGDNFVDFFDYDDFVAAFEVGC